MVEGIVSDLARGHLPNIFGEMGLKAEWKHNRKSLVTKIVVGAVIASVAIVFFSKKKDD
jgi:hypothetical protein